MRDDLQLDCRDWGGMMEGLVHKVTGHNNHLGDVHIPLRMLYEELHPGGMVEKDIPLNHTVKGFIRVGLQFTPDPSVVMPAPSTVRSSVSRTCCDWAACRAQPACWVAVAASSATRAKAPWMRR